MFGLDWESVVRKLAPSKGTYEVLGSIAKARLKLAVVVFKTFKVVLQNKENRGYSLYSAYEVLGSIATARPELAGDVLETLKVALQQEKNDGLSLIGAYRALGSIATARPELAGDVLETLKVALQNKKNHENSLINAYWVLGDIVKERPELAEDVFETFKIVLQNKKNDECGLYSAYKVLGDIVKERPKLSGEVVKLVLSSLGKIEKRYILLSQCMRHCKIDDFKDITNKQRQDLQAAYNMRYSNEEEIRYALDHMSIEQIAEKMFSGQQRCMNVLVSQIGKERGLAKEEVINYRKDPDNAVYKDNADWLVPASFKAQEVFGCYFPSYIKSTEKYLSSHDAVYWLPKNMSEEKNKSFAAFIQSNLIYADINGKKQARDLSEMEIIAKNWQSLKPEEEKLKYKDILAVCRSRKYKNQEHDGFAVEAAKWGVFEERYKNIESIYLAGLKVPEPFDSSKRFQFGSYCGRFLPRDDVRTGFFGGYTNCCQHFDGVGKECAISTVKDPYSQLFVIENQEGKIVAGSWVWENKNGDKREVCFDNIEAIGDFSKHPMINEIYDKVGKYLAEEAQCSKVTIGMGYQDADTSCYEVTASVPLPKQYGNCYSDAKGTQVLLAKNPQAKDLDKNKESARFVRNACFLDIGEMSFVSERCFPDSDKHLQLPDEPSGLVLVDEQKGVVGYCLYDKQEREIYDMAVLPEYRTDSNCSSRKLFAETIKQINEIGGEWSAELRDKTTYKYLEIMSQRGMVTFENHGVDHEMSDGSKVYSVTFKVNSNVKDKTNSVAKNMALQKAKSGNGM